MTTKGLPKGYHSVTPALILRDAATGIDFYKRAFGASELSRMNGPDGKVMHAEIMIGDSRIMIGEENLEWDMKSPLSTNGVSTSLYVYVDYVDKAFDLAVKEGATVRFPLEDTFWGDRFGKLTDPFGHEWGLAKRVRDLTEEEVKRGAEEWMAKAGQTAQ